MESRATTERDRLMAAFAAIDPLGSRDAHGELCSEAQWVVELRQKAALAFQLIEADPDNAARWRWEATRAADRAESIAAVFNTDLSVYAGGPVC